MATCTVEPSEIHYPSIQGMSSQRAFAHTCTHLWPLSHPTHTRLRSSVPGLSTTAYLPSFISTTLGDNWLMVVNVPMSHAKEILNASYQLYQHVKVSTHPAVSKQILCEASTTALATVPSQVYKAFSPLTGRFNSRGHCSRGSAMAFAPHFTVTHCGGHQNGHRMLTVNLNLGPLAVVE